VPEAVEAQLGESTILPLADHLRDVHAKLVNELSLGFTVFWTRSLAVATEVAPQTALLWNRGIVIHALHHNDARNESKPQGAVGRATNTDSRVPWPLAAMRCSLL
jgi:hypothetical protein